MKANQINAIAKDIRANRQKFESIVNDFRAYWGKVYRNEVTTELNKVAELLKTDPKNETLKNQRYALEQVCAKIKGLTLTDEIKGIIRELHDVDRLTFSCLRADYITTALEGLDYIGADGQVYEQKKNKQTGEKEWKVIEKWTEAKVGRYFRLATVRINESK